MPDPGLRRGPFHGPGGLSVPPAAAEHLFQRPGGDSIRRYADDVYLHAVFPLRRHGRDGRHDARHGLFSHADDRFSHRRLRPASAMDFHHFRRLPHAALAVYLLSHLLGCHGLGPRGLLLVCPPQNAQGRRPLSPGLKTFPGCKAQISACSPGKNLIYYLQALQKAPMRL